MATVNFLYRSIKERANLNLRLLYRKNEIDFVFGAKTKLEVSKQYWTKQHKKKSKDIDITNLQTEINNELNKIENYIIKSFNSVNQDSITKEWLQTQIDNYYNPPKEKAKLPTVFLKYFEFFMYCKESEIKIGTKRKYNVTKRLLERYEYENKIELNIIDINSNFKKEFEIYCLKNNYALNTISKNIKTIKTICNHAKQNGVKINEQLENIKTPYHKTETIYLSFEDLDKIENIDQRRLNDNYDHAKDWLIISCYTGQRVSDFMRFNKSMIRYEKNKQGEFKPLLEFIQVKTEKKMTIALHPKVIEILDKRDGNFPKIISDQKYNLYIKQVCRIANIDEIIKGGKLVDIKKNVTNEHKQYRKETGMFKKWELVTSHIGRRSFATNFYGTIPTTYLINVTGHSTEAMFLNYIGKSNKDLAIEIANFY